MDTELDEILTLINSLMATLAPILKRADEANLISPTEQTELMTLLTASCGLFLKFGGTEQELLTALEAKGES